ncbi:MAG: GPW/gp25 family protein [Bryobacteraceae bacterium]
MNTPDPSKAFLGVGWAFAPCVERDGHIALVQYEEDIRQSIRIILGTDPGERVMRPDFGAGLSQFVFEPLDATTMNLVKTRVQESLIAWEPRIDILSVNVTADSTEHNKLLIEMVYRVRVTNSQFNLVYPFFLQEGPVG